MLGCRTLIHICIKDQITNLDACNLYMNFHHGAFDLTIQVPKSEAIDPDKTFKFLSRSL